MKPKAWVGAISARLSRSRAAPLLRAVFRIRFFETARRRLFLAMSLDDVLEVLDALERAGVRAWLAGGWGMDALLGGPTRRHFDVDLVLDAGDDPLPRALPALAAIGFGHVQGKIGGGWMPERLNASDGAGRTVDLLPVDPGALPHQPPFTTGTLAGREVPCLAPGLQAAFHTGYRLPRAHRRDLARLRARFALPEAPPPPPGSSRRHLRRAGHVARRARARLLRRREPEGALLVPVPAADPVVAAARRADAEPAGGMPAHVTVLYPFAPLEGLDRGVDRKLAPIVARFPPFRFRLTAVARFPGVVYLVVEPPEPFEELTRAVVAHWPECPPYRGAHARVIPHLAVVEGDEPLTVEPTLERHLPIEAEAGEVWLVTVADDGWQLVGRFPLGG